MRFGATFVHCALASGPANKIMRTKREIAFMTEGEYTHKNGALDGTKSLRPDGAAVEPFCIRPVEHDRPAPALIVNEPVRSVRIVGRSVR